eukprot:gene32630-39449_t
MLEDGVHLVDKLFTGEKWISKGRFVVENGLISSVEDGIFQDSDVACRHHSLLVPTFLDLQIYGAHGKLLAEYPCKDSLYMLHDYCRAGNAEYFVAAVATNTWEVCCRCIDAVRDYWKSGGRGCLGLHMEGPWISIAKRGAHTIENVRENPSVEEVRSLLDYGKDVIKIITIAPEVCSNEVIALIRSYGVVISAGHSNATYEEATRCFDLGYVTTVTHLFNAMSSFNHRLPGLAGAVLNHPAVFASIVADGHHVDYAAITIAK